MLTGSGTIANVIFPAVGGVVGVHFGWRVAAAAGALTAVLVLVATLLTVPSLPPANADRTLHTLVAFRQILALLSRLSIAYCVTIGALVGFTFQAISSFFPTFLVEYQGLEIGTAGIAFGALVALSALAQPVAGHVSDLHSRYVAIATSVSVSLIAVMTLPSVLSTAGFLIGIALLGIGVSWSGPIKVRFFDHLDDAERGFGFGRVRTLYVARILGKCNGRCACGHRRLGGWGGRCARRVDDESPAARNEPMVRSRPLTHQTALSREAHPRNHRSRSKSQSRSRSRSRDGQASPSDWNGSPTADRGRRLINSSSRSSPDVN